MKQRGCVYLTIELFLLTICQDVSQCSRFDQSWQLAKYGPVITWLQHIPSDVLKQPLSMHYREQSAVERRPLCTTKQVGRYQGIYTEEGV